MCQTAIVYRRIVDGRRLDFDHCGYLYKGSFVMFDKQTESEWLHVTAECMLGPLRGKRLEIVPTQLLTWIQWRSRQPNTTVMKDSESWQSQPTENNDFTNKRLRERIGFNVQVDGKSKLYPFRLLESLKLINDDLDGIPVVAIYVSSAKSAVAWSPILDGKALRFRELETDDGIRLQDIGTSSLWDPLAGAAISGPLSGSELNPLIGIPIRQRRYFDLFPHGTVYEIQSPKPTKPN